MKRIAKILIVLAGNLLMLASCYKDGNYKTEKRNLGNLFQLKANNDSIPADSNSLVEISVIGLPETISEADNKISLETDNGLFVSTGTKKMDVVTSLVFENNKYIRKGTAMLKSESKVKTAIIKGTLKGVTDTCLVKFYKVLPEKIKISSSLIFFTPSYTNPLTFEVLLSRAGGVPTQGAETEVKVTDDAGREVGVFQRYDNFSNGEGKCFFAYFFTDTSYHGFLKCKAVYNQVVPALKDSVLIRSL